MPNCLEKQLLALNYCIASMIILNQDPRTDSNLCKKIHKILELLQARLIIEEPDNSEYKTSLDKIRNQISLKDWHGSQIEIEALLRKMRPLNIQELSFLIDKAKEAAACIKDQNIILFLGKTGAGKSTMIHFLAGSKMTFQKVDIGSGKSLEHIAPSPPFSNPALDDVTISAAANSETRYIKPVLVHFKDLGGFDNKSITLCDSPGFGDTGGPEVDIAIGLGIIEAIKSCKSVKPVILFSYLSMEDRGEGIRKMAHLLVNMVVDIYDKLNAFSYFFTKFPATTDIHATLLNIKKHVDTNEEERSDESFNALFTDMLEKTEEDAFRIDPIKDRPLSVLKKLVQSASINNPREAFKVAITESSRNALYEQARKHQLNIYSALKRAEYELIEYKLNELNFLSNVLKDNFVQQLYKDSLSQISGFLDKEYRQQVGSFNAYLDKQNPLEVKLTKKFILRTTRIALPTYQEIEHEHCWEDNPNNVQSQNKRWRLWCRIYLHDLHSIQQA